MEINMLEIKINSKNIEKLFFIVFLFVIVLIDSTLAQSKHSPKNVNYAPNYGKMHVGDTYNYPKARTVTSKLINEIINNIPNDSLPISIVRRSTDAESYAFATQITIELKKKKYNAFVSGIIYDKDVGADDKEGQLDIVIPENSFLKNIPLSTKVERKSGRRFTQKDIELFKKFLPINCKTITIGVILRDIESINLQNQMFDVLRQNKYPVRKSGLRIFDSTTPNMVMIDTSLGRSKGMVIVTIWPSTEQ